MFLIYSLQNLIGPRIDDYWANYLLNREEKPYLSMPCMFVSTLEYTLYAYNEFE